LPFFRSVATAAVARENGIAGNVFPYTYKDEVTRTLIGCPPTAERQKQDSILFATERQLRRKTAQRQVGTTTAQRNFFYVSNVILTALTEFLRNLCNCSGKTATERWKLGINNTDLS